MSKIITPGNEGFETALSGLNREQRRALEKKLAQPITRAELPHLVMGAFGGQFAQVYEAVSQTNLVITAFGELLEEAGILTKDQVKEKVEEIMNRVTPKEETVKQVGEKRATPNSPALEESQKAAGGEVQRLDEVPPAIVESESAPRRLVD